MVEVSVLPPRPELLELLGIAYRRVPVLAIGNDVYCDSSLIVSVLERTFPPSEGYPTLFPKRKGSMTADTGLVKSLSMFYVDRLLYNLGAFSYPYEKLPDVFVKDRNEHFGPGGALDLLDMVPRRKEFAGTLSSHLDLIEEQVSDGREWLLDTELPGLADISVHFTLLWIRECKFDGFDGLFDPEVFPRTISWLERTTAYLQEFVDSSTFRHFTGMEAANIVASSKEEDLAIIGFNSVEAGRLGLQLGDLVSVEPEDTGRVPTIGKLVALNRQEVVIETHGSAADVVRCHFPRLAFRICRYTTPDSRL